MRLLHRNILTIGRLFVLLFFLANSGFTVVLYHCTMTDEMCDMSCCAGTGECGAGTCQDMEEGRAPATDAHAVAQPCETATVVGGYQTEPTVLEKEFTGRQIIKYDLLLPSVFETAIADRVDLPAFHIVSAASNVSPPSVETYVLNATFLI